MTSQFGVWITSDRAARVARDMTADKRAQQREVDRAAAYRRGETPPFKAADGLDLLYQNGELTDDMLRVGRSYHKAWVSIQGGRGRNPLDQTPPGDVDGAMQSIVDAGKLVDRIEAHCTATGELGVLRAVCGLGISVRQFAGGGRAHRRAQDLLIGLLSRIAETRLW